MTGHHVKEARKRTEALLSDIEALSQVAAGAEAALYARDRTADQLASWRFEYELTRETECLEVVAVIVEARLRKRRTILDEQRRIRFPSSVTER